MLDLSFDCPKTLEELEVKFDKIAHRLLNRTLICTPKNKYRICEIEFYFTDNKKLTDPFIHTDEFQETPNQFYFHRQNGKGFKSGTYKGLDLTFGLRSKKTFGGILIRSIRNKKTGEITEGPCKCVQHFLEDNNVINCGELYELLEKNVVITNDRTKPLYTRTIKSANNKMNNNKIFKGPRVGLTLKNRINWCLRTEYLMKPWRYCNIIPSKYKPTLIVYEHVLNNTEVKDLAKMFKLSEKKVDNYLIESNNFADDWEDYCKKSLTIKDLLEMSGKYLAAHI